jgi:hypothetical protein
MTPGCEIDCVLCSCILGLTHSGNPEFTHGLKLFSLRLQELHLRHNRHNSTGRRLRCY